MMIFKKIENELANYTSGGEKEISQGVTFSQFNLVNKIFRFRNKVYESGRYDSQGNYKYWFDIIQSNVDSEVKNIDFDTSNIDPYSEEPDDNGDMFWLATGLDEWMRVNKQGVVINDSVEEGAALGNLVWKKVKGGYELFDAKNFYVINETARTLNDSPVIERHVFTQKDLRDKKGVWIDTAIDAVIEQCQTKASSTTKDGAVEIKEIPQYEIYERNGEVSLAELYEARGESYSDEDNEVYTLAKIVVAGISGGDGTGAKHVLFADKISEMPYIEYHRGPYKGRWWREGLYELLFDLQVRANQIGNEIAQGLRWSAKTIFKDSANSPFDNVMTDLLNGDVVRSSDFSQVEVRMNGFDQLVADWNRVIELANKISNSSEIVSGGEMKAGTPFKLGALMNQNANKLYVFIREKLALSFTEIYEKWVVPDVLKDLKKQSFFRVGKKNRNFDKVAEGVGASLASASGGMLDDSIKQAKQQNELFVKRDTEFKGIKPKISIVIDGENVNMNRNMETMSSLISLETDPVRRTAMIEIAAKWALPTLDFTNLPKSVPQAVAPSSQGISMPSDSGQLGAQTL